MTSSIAIVAPTLGPSEIRPGFADRFLPVLVEQQDPVVLWDSVTNCDALVQKWVGHVDAQDEVRYLQIYCEIQLGQLLGENPRAGPGRGKKNGIPSFSIPQQTLSEIRRFYGWRDRLIPEIQEDRKLNRKLRTLDSRHGCLTRVRRWEAAERLPAIRGAAARAG